MAILKCSCKHEFQDRTYGKGMRVFNETKIKDRFRCTVCVSLKTKTNIVKDNKKR